MAARRIAASCSCRRASSSRKGTRSGRAPPGQPLWSRKPQRTGSSAGQPPRAASPCWCTTAACAVSASSARTRSGRRLPRPAVAAAARRRRAGRVRPGRQPHRDRRPGADPAVTDTGQGAPADRAAPAAGQAATAGRAADWLDRAIQHNATQAPGAGRPITANPVTRARTARRGVAARARYSAWRADVTGNAARRPLLRMASARPTGAVRRRPGSLRDCGSGRSPWPTRSRRGRRQAEYSRPSASTRSRTPSTALARQLGDVGGHRGTGRSSARTSSRVASTRATGHAGSPA